MDLFGYYMSDEDAIMKVAQKIEGLSYHLEFLSESEETELIRAIDNEPWLHDLKRKVQHYGYKYDYRARKIDQSFRIGNLPDWSTPIAEKMISQGLINFEPDQLIINNYEAGEGIAMHIDCEPCFSDTIISLSLNSDIVMDFQHVSSHDKEELLLRRRSLLIMTGDARYQYKHGIAPRKKDMFNNHTRKRQRRISLTFRKVILE